MAPSNLKDAATSGKPLDYQIWKIIAASGVGNTGVDMADNLLAPIRSDHLCA